MLTPPQLVPVPAALPLRRRRVGEAGAAARRGRAGPLRRLLQPGSGRGVGDEPAGSGRMSEAAAAAERQRSSRSRSSRSTSRSRAGSCSTGTSATSGRSTTSSSRSGAARRSASSASPAAASRRSGGRCSCSTSRRPGEIVFDGQDLTKLDAEGVRTLRRRMQMVFQDPFASLNPRHSVGRSSASRCASHGLADKQAGERARARAARGRRPAAGRGDALPARVLGRAAPAHRPRARARRSTLTSSSPTSPCPRSTCRSRRRSSTCSRSSRPSST